MLRSVLSTVLCVCARSDVAATLTRGKPVRRTTPASEETRTTWRPCAPFVGPVSRALTAAWTSSCREAVTTFAAPPAIWTGAGGVVESRSASLMREWRPCICTLVFALSYCTSSVCVPADDGHHDEELCKLQADVPRPSVRDTARHFCMHWSSRQGRHELG